MNIICSISTSGPSPAGIAGLRLEAPCTATTADFFEALGFDRTVAGDSWQFSTGNHSDPLLSILDAPRKRLRGVDFRCDPSDLDAFAERARGAQRAVSRDGTLLRIAAPDGLDVILHGDAKYVPPQIPDSPLLPHAPSRGLAGIPRPIALSHVAIFVSDMAQALDFYTGVIGLALSDRCGDGLAFLHSPRGSVHHLLALVHSSAPGLHHYSFEMGTIDAIELRAAHVAQHGYTDGWGLGRHVLGSNFFHYIRDPWNSYVELTAGLDFIAAGAPWVAGDHPAEDAFYLWGPPPPADFIDNPEIPTAAPLVGAAA